ncbi:MAG: VWA domain-containing protein, partial [Microscillaceae bacterium]|nr:VWA domain-containing protein [Microscillaceae bacterium]
MKTSVVLGSPQLGNSAPLLVHTQAIHPFARVLCCLEVAPSLREVYESGSLSALLRQLLPLLVLLDDNGKLDMYRFAQQAYPAGELGPEDFENFLAETKAYFDFSKSPDYQELIQKIRSTYLRPASNLEDR